MFLSNKYFQQIIKKEHTGTTFTIYMPTHPASTSSTLSEDVIRFKNSIQKVRAHDEYEERELGKTVEKLELLLDDTDFWKHRTLGLAVFANKDGYETVDLNYEIIEMQYVQDRYVVSPLAIMLSIGTGYYVLEINHTRPRLLYFSSYFMKEIDLKDMPGSLEQTIDRDEHIQRIQHQGAPKNIFHGQEDSSAEDADILRYYKIITNSVDKFLTNHHEPLVLTGTENRVGNIRPLFKYDNVVNEFVKGNNEEMNIQELKHETSNVIENLEIAYRKKLVDKAKSTPPSNLAVGHIDIETALAKGRVETLYISAFKRTADNVRGSNNKTIVLQLPGDINQTESLVRGTFTLGGNVQAVLRGSFNKDEPLALCRF